MSVTSMPEITSRDFIRSVALQMVPCVLSSGDVAEVKGSARGRMDDSGVSIGRLEMER
jgi:hypothetical protein